MQVAWQALAQALRQRVRLPTLAEPVLPEAQVHLQDGFSSREVGASIDGGGQGERQQDEEEDQEQCDAAHGGQSPSKPRGGGVRACGSSSTW